MSKSRARASRSNLGPGRAGRAAARLAAQSSPRGDGSSWYRITAKGPDCVEVMIYDEIGYWGITAKKFCEDLAAIEASSITLRINSPGGQVFDGFAIYSALQAHEAEVHVKIDGLAASIASIIAMAGDTVEIGPNAFVMIHDPSSYAFGNAADLRKEADLLDKLRDAIAKVYADKSGKPLDQIKAKMAEETWFTGDEALEFGLVDSIASDDDDDDDQEDRADLARTAAKVAIFSAKLPERLKRVAAAVAGAHPPSPFSTPKTETPMALKITIRDGKQFVNIDGKEHEVENGQPAPTPAPAAQPTNSAAPISQADLEAAKRQAVEDERKYAAEFDTAVTASGMDAAKAAQFRKDFYGRPIADVKWLATNAIGARATAVGEGGAAPEQPKDKKNEDPEKAITDAAVKRFDAEQGVRNMFGAKHAVKGTDQYKAACDRYVAGELKHYRDNLPANRSQLISGAATA